MPLHPGPAGPPPPPLTVLHLDNIASGHPVGGDKHVVGALYADEVLHGGGRPGAGGGGSTGRGTRRLLCLTGETAPRTAVSLYAGRATAPATGALG